MSERQRYGDGTSRVIYNFDDFRVDEIALPPMGKTEMLTHRESHVGVVFKGNLTLYRGWGSGVIVERYQKGEHFVIDANVPHGLEAGEGGVELIQTSSLVP